MNEERRIQGCLRDGDAIHGHEVARAGFVDDSGLDVTMRRRGVAESLGMVIMAILVSLMALALESCSNNDDEAYNSMPDKVKQFVARYYPGYGVKSYTTSGDVVHLRLDNGPGITFDKDLNLEGVNGYGTTLPQVLLFDMLPPAMFDYLQSTDELNDVFAMTFTADDVTVELMSSRIVYDVKTAKISRVDIT